MHAPTSLHRPLPHPSLRGDPQKIGDQRQSLMWVDLPRHWAEVDHARIRPVRWQTTEIDRAGPFADRLGAPAAEILVHEEGWRLRVLSDDRQLIREWLQRRYVDSVDALAVAAPGEHAHPRSKACRRQRRVECGAAEDTATVG